MNDNMIVIFDTIIALFGLYMIYTTYEMKKTGVINKMLLAKEEINKIKDSKGFIDSIYKKIMIFGALVTVDGVVGLISDLVVTIPYWSLIEMVTFVIAVLVFTHFLRKAREKYLFN